MTRDELARKIVELIFDACEHRNMLDRWNPHNTQAGNDGVYRVDVSDAVTALLESGRMTVFADAQLRRP